MLPPVGPLFSQNEESKLPGSSLDWVRGKGEVVGKETLYLTSKCISDQVKTEH